MRYRQIIKSMQKGRRSVKRRKLSEEYKKKLKKRNIWRRKSVWRVRGIA